MKTSDILLGGIIGFLLVLLVADPKLPAWARSWILWLAVIGMSVVAYQVCINQGKS